MAMDRTFGDMSRKGATVVAVNVSSGGIPKRPVPEARVTSEGLQGDFHEHKKHCREDRAISIQDIELLDALRAEGYAVAPGLMGENLTVCDLDVQSLFVGDRLILGTDVVLELTSVRKPCYVLDQIDPKLKEAVVGRCGMMAKVIAGGTLKPGQKITVQRAFADASQLCRTISDEHPSLIGCKLIQPEGDL